MSEGRGSIKKILLYGFLVWLIPFIVSMLIFPIKTSSPALFESIMPVALTICAVLFSVLYFRGLEAGMPREGVLLGLIWFAISIAIDLLMFMWGPMKMSFAHYMMDIGLTYLIIPTVTVGFGYLLQRR
jgi:hypothetical protein